MSPSSSRKRLPEIHTSTFVPSTTPSRNLYFGMPSPPTSIGSPKEVRFDQLPDSTSTRPLTPREEAALGHLEQHAASCRHCVRPYDGYKEGRYMCSEGGALTRSCDVFLCWKDRHLCTKPTDVRGRIRLELNGDFKNAKQALKLVHKTGDRAFSKSKSRSHTAQEQHSGHKRHSGHGSSDTSGSPTYYSYCTFQPASTSPPRGDERRDRSSRTFHGTSQRSESTSATVGHRSPVQYRVEFTSGPGRY